MRKRKKEALDFSTTNDESAVPVMDAEEVVETATNAVVDELPERKKKKYQRDWGNRPAHLRKNISEMRSEERAEYYRWKADQELGVSEEATPYTQEEMAAMGSFFLPLITSRMPNPLPPTEEEIQGFARVFTAFLNKYAITFAYKEEFNVLLYTISFILPRLKPVSIG